jgi:cobaltochelatase CobT
MGADTLQVQLRRQQAQEELRAATVRALAQQPDLHYRGGKLHRLNDRLPSFAPHLHPNAQSDDIRSLKGAADAIAMRLLHSDWDQHQALAPTPMLARMLFDVLEQFRCESLADEAMPGLRNNMLHRFDVWSMAYVASNLNESAQGLLLLTVAQMCRTRVTHQPVTEALEDMMEATRFGLSQRIGHDLAALRSTRFSQADYAVHACRIALTVSSMVESERELRGQKRNRDQEEAVDKAWQEIWVDFDAGDEAAMLAAGNARRLEDDSAANYRVFTRAYDREVAAHKLVRTEELKSLRSTLDQYVAAAGVSPAQLARALQAILAKPLRDDWNHGQEEGSIDGRRLAQLIASPTERRIFRTERMQPVTDCGVCLLVDCSGSMKQHMAKLAPLLDLLARALEMAGAQCEVLGYTTGAWNGGRALRDWRKAGKPSQPGRLNELCHIVFKNAATPWRKAKSDIAATLKPELFRECIDAEALRWASGRLMEQDVERRILIVFADGSPMDSATALCNDADYLDRDLQAASALLEREDDLELLAFGVGLDMSLYYSKSHVLDLGDSPSHTIQEIVSLLAKRR